MLTLASSILIIVVVFATSVLSGILGMAGGIILMGVLASLFQLPLAMAAHGFAQLVANGTRFLSLIKFVDWQSCTYYSAGTASSAVIFWFISYSPSLPLLFITLGAIPIFALLPWTPKFDFQQPLHAILCGFINTAMHLTAGVSGPVLDLFFVNSQMNRFEIIANKAYTQTLGHALKIGYFASMAAGLVDLPLWLPFGVAASAFLGTHVGGFVLRRLSEVNFRSYLRRVFLVIGLVYIARGAWEML